jgi:hypothetical protein
MPVVNFHEKLDRPDPLLGPGALFFSLQVSLVGYDAAGAPLLVGALTLSGEQAKTMTVGARPMTQIA